MGIPIGDTIIGVTMERPRGEGRIMEEVFRKAIGAPHHKNILSSDRIR